MKILYIGTVSENNEYEKILKESRVKASAAPQAFETAFIKGLAENGVAADDINFLSFPMIASFPGSKFLKWGEKKQKLLDFYDVTWIPAINIQGLKMFSQAISSKKLIEKWFKENLEIEYKCVIMYSLYKPVAENVIKLCKQYGCKCFAFVPDLPKHMYLSKTGIRAIIADRYVKKTLKIQDKFNGYIYLTQAMRDEVAPKKPYIIVEGVADITNEPSKETTRRDNVVMYAGAISKRYGFESLVEAFNAINGDYELHIYGYGDYVPELLKYAEKDLRIKYMGRCPRTEILEKEKEAALLVNVRNPDDEFTKFSFPSKTMEYMLSGTPLLTTRLPGIPEVYFDYCLSIENNSTESIKGAIESFFAMDKLQRGKIGLEAKNFIASEKNQKVQAAKVLNFIKENVCN